MDQKHHVIHLLLDAAKRLEAGENISIAIGVDFSGAIETPIIGTLPVASLLVSTLHSGLLETIREERINMKVVRADKVN